MRRRAARILLAVLALAAACRGPQEPLPADGAGSRAPPASTAGEGGTIALLSIPFEEWQAELAARRGRIVLVDFWATWCLPCLERFPHTVEMARKYAGRGVDVVSLSLDGTDDRAALEYAREFLVEQRAAFPNFLLDETVPDAFEKLGLNGIPAVFLYDRSGELAYRLTGDDPRDQFTDTDVEQAIQALLATMAG